MERVRPNHEYNRTLYTWDLNSSFWSIKNVSHLFVDGIEWLRLELYPNYKYNIGGV